MVGGFLLSAAPPGVRVGGTCPLLPIYQDDEPEPHYIDSSEDSDHNTDTKSPSPPVLRTTPPPLKTIAFDWSSLNFGDLQFSPASDKKQNDENSNKNNRYSAEILPDETYSDNIKNILKTKESSDKLKDPKSIFKNCKRKIIKSGKSLSDRSRSVEIGQGGSVTKTSKIFRHRSSGHQHGGVECCDTNGNSTPRGTISYNNQESNNLSRSHGTTGSVASLPAGVKLRVRIKESMWVTGVRRRESIGLITQPMLSAIRGAGRRVKYRARSVSKVSEYSSFL